MNPILEFQGEYRWLSNFVQIKDGVSLRDGTDVIYPTVEHAYQMAKLPVIDRIMLKDASRRMTAGDIKKASKSWVIRQDWEDDKLSIMLDLQRQKYSTRQYQTPLLETVRILDGKTLIGADPWAEYDNQENFMMIEEGNKWGDTFWGVDLKKGYGKNHLGKIIMQVRNEIIAKANNIDWSPKWQTWSYE